MKNKIIEKKYHVISKSNTDSTINTDMIDIANNPKSKMPIILELDSALFILSLSISIVPFT